MYSESNSFKRNIQLTETLKQNIFIFVRNKKSKTYFFFDSENKLLLYCKYEKGIYNIYDTKNIIIASIHSKGIRYKKFYLYFKKKSNNQIIGIHENSSKSHKLLNIPFVYEFNNGFNSFKDYNHMINSDNTNKKRIILESFSFSKPIKFENDIKSKKNAQYYESNNLRFELSKKNNDTFDIYAESPLSILQVLMLSIINVN